MNKSSKVKERELTVEQHNTTSFNTVTEFLVIFIFYVYLVSKYSGSRCKGIGKE